MAKSISMWMRVQSLDQLVLTRLPEWSEIEARFAVVLPKPSTYTAGNVDDFSPEINQEGVGVLNIVPFSELNNIIKNGDIVLFMEPRLNVFDAQQLMRQRAYHAEIAFRNPDGVAVQCGPYGGENEIQEYQCTELCSNHRFSEDRRNIHIFRIAASVGEDDQICRLLKGVRLWRHVYHHYKFPSLQGKWFFDPADFGTVAELEDLARRLILDDEIPEMYCMQWVHAVLSLALNVPLNRPTLDRLGVLDRYQKRWPDLGFADDSVLPLGRLPIVPYSPSDHVLSLCRLYLGMSDVEAKAALPVFLQQDVFQNLLAQIPPLSVPPIVVFSEYRKPGHEGNVSWEYVATAFPDNQCKRQ